MLTIILDSINDLPQTAVLFEHSLVTLSKWEAEQGKPFFGKAQMTPEETLAYIKNMVQGEPPDHDWTKRLTSVHYETITGYINSKQSATWFREDPNARKSNEIITNELIYYWMIGFGIPFEPCDTWHLSRLMNLIRICGIKQTKPKKMSRQAQAEEYRRLNAQRREQLGTSG